MFQPLPTQEECQLCLKDHLEAGKQPEKLVQLPFLTINKGLSVKACPWCDGIS